MHDFILSRSYRVAQKLIYSTKEKITNNEITLLRNYFVLTGDTRMVPTTINKPWHQQQNPLKKLQGFFRLPVIQNSSASVPPEWQSHFRRGETTAVLFVLICGIPLTLLLRGVWPSCIKLN